MAETVVARNTMIPDAIRRGMLLDVLPDRSGFRFLLDPGDDLACPGCGRALLAGFLVQQIALAGPRHLTYVWRCLLCPDPPRFIDEVAA